MFDEDRLVNFIKKQNSLFVKNINILSEKIINDYSIYFKFSKMIINYDDSYTTTNIFISGLDDECNNWNEIISKPELQTTNIICITLENHDIQNLINLFGLQTNIIQTISNFIINVFNDLINRTSVNFICHSIGCYVGFEIAKKIPNNLNKIVFVDITLPIYIVELNKHRGIINDLIIDFLKSIMNYDYFINTFPSKIKLFSLFPNKKIQHFLALEIPSYVDNGIIFKTFKDAYDYYAKNYSEYLIDNDKPGYIANYFNFGKIRHMDKLYNSLVPGMTQNISIYYDNLLEGKVGVNTHFFYNIISDEIINYLIQ